MSTTHDHSDRHDHHPCHLGGARCDLPRARSVSSSTPPVRGGTGTGRLCTPEPSFDPFTTVIGVRGTPYPSPHLGALDAHLRWLQYRLAHCTPRFPALTAEFLADVDLLLDRRRWLEIDATTPAA